MHSLVRANINPSLKGGSYRTILQAAVFRGHAKVAQALLNAGSGTYSPGISKDAFQAAAEGGREATARPLLEGTDDEVKISALSRSK